MGAPKDNKNADGNKGGNGAPTVQDRELSKKVRALTLEKCLDILKQPVVKMTKEDYELWKAVLLKLAGTVLPRLNEHSGEGGGAIPVQTELAPKEMALLEKVLLKQGLIKPEPEKKSKSKENKLPPKKSVEKKE